jgi:CBS domain-containing protein
MAAPHRARSFALKDSTQGEREMEFDIATAPGSPLAPRFEHASVGDVMRRGVISCEPEDSLRSVARIMSSYHVHSVVVALGGDIWGVISANDVVEAAGTPRERLSAGEIAATEVVTVTEDEPLERGAQLMREHEVSHVIVTARGGKPIGIVSTLDIAGTLAWGEA